MKYFKDNNRLMYVVMAATVLLALSIMVGFSVFLNQDRDGKKGDADDGQSYAYHVAMVSADTSDVFWESLYEEARSTGASAGIYAENFGALLNEDYTASELMRMAIDSRVDGIIVETDDTEDIEELIGQAEEAGIPVVTLMEDIPESGRVSYVGANDYTLGEMYGQEVLKAVGSDRTSASAAVLVPVNEEETSPSFIYTGISETVGRASGAISVSTVRTGEDREFLSEERVRSLLLDEESRPDVLVCLNVVDTISAYQCVRDYNLVGKVKIIGYYSSPEILEGIQKGIIESTIVVDAREAGELCMQAMEEYLSQRYTSEYFPVSVKLVNEANVEEYIQEESGE